MGDATAAPMILPRPGPFAEVRFRRRPFACATNCTANSSPRSPALSVAERRPKRITFALPSPARSAERSAMNTRCRSADSITASCIAMAMKRHGGLGSASIPCRSHSSYGGGQDCRTHRKRSCPSPCPRSSRLQWRGSTGCHWATPGTGSSNAGKVLLVEVFWTGARGLVAQAISKSHTIENNS